MYLTLPTPHPTFNVNKDPVSLLLFVVVPHNSAPHTATSPATACRVPTRSQGTKENQVVCADSFNILLTAFAFGEFKAKTENNWTRKMLQLILRTIFFLMIARSQSNE